MGDSYKTLDDHLALLKHRGFDEKGLGLNSEPGTIEKEFRNAYAQVVKDAKIAQAPKSIFFTTPAKSSGNKKVALFNFHYLFDPFSDTLFLKSVVMKVDKFQHILLMPDSRDLQMVTQFFALLAPNKKLNDARKIISAPKEHLSNKLKQ